MATYYDYAYYIDGEYLALLQKSAVAVYDPYPQVEENFLTPQNDDSSGVMIEYCSNKDYPSSETSTLDVSRQLALAIVDFVKHKLLEDSNKNKSDEFYAKFMRRVSRAQSNKSGEPTIIMPQGVGALK